MSASPLDHGVLNIAGRTSRINADLDKHLAAQSVKAKSEAKARATQFKADKAKAIKVLAEVGPGIVAQTAPGIAKRRGLTIIKAAREVTHELDQMVKWEPAKFLALAERFKREQGDAA